MNARSTSRSRTRPAALALATALAAATLLGGCGVLPDRAQTDSSAGTTAAAPDPGESSSDQGGGEDPGGTPSDQAQSGEVLGSSTGSHAADPNDSTAVPLRLDVTSIQRSAGDTVEVRFSITNTSDAATYEPWSTMADDTLAAGGGYDVGGAVLIDLEGDRKYLTLIDTDSVCLCTTFASAGSDGIPPGESLEMYAQFPAPPEATTTIDFGLPGFAPVNGLEIG